MKTYIRADDCPFKPGDLVECIHSGVQAIVVRIEDEHVYCQKADASVFYRTWSHEMGYKSGGWLKLVERPEPEPVADVIDVPPSAPSPFLADSVAPAAELAEATESPPAL